MSTISVRTDDIVLATFLICQGHRLIDIDVNSMGIGTFIFNGVNEKTLLCYHAGSSLVEPKSFNKNLVQLSRSCRTRK